MNAFHLPSMERMHVNNSKQLRFCAVLIIVSMFFVYLPTTLVFGQNEIIHTISINEDSESLNTNILESSRVEYNSSGWTNFTLAAFAATYQEHGSEKNFFETDFRFVFYNVYSGSSDKLIYQFFLASSFFGRDTIPLENESSISLVFFIINNNRTFEDIEFKYSVEPMGESVGIPTILSQEDTGLPFSSIAFIAAFAALGSIVTLISVKRMKFRR